MLIICSLFESDAGVGIPTPILRLFLAGLSCGVVCVILRLAVLVELRLVTDGRTDGQTDTGPWLVPRMHSFVR